MTTLHAYKVIDGRTLYAVNYNGDKLTDDVARAYTLFDDYRAHFRALGFTITENDTDKLLAGHKSTGEPLSEAEVEQILEAGLAKHYDFNDIGGGLYALSCFVTDEDPALEAADTSEPLGPNEDPWGDE